MFGVPPESEWGDGACRRGGRRRWVGLLGQIRLSVRRGIRHGRRRSVSFCASSVPIIASENGPRVGGPDLGPDVRRDGAPRARHRRRHRCGAMVALRFRRSGIALQPAQVSVEQVSNWSSRANCASIDPALNVVLTCRGSLRQGLPSCRSRRDQRPRSRCEPPLGLMSVGTRHGARSVGRSVTGHPAILARSCHGQTCAGVRTVCDERNSRCRHCLARFPSSGPWGSFFCSYCSMAEQCGCRWRSVGARRTPTTT